MIGRPFTVAPRNVPVSERSARHHSRADPRMNSGRSGSNVTMDLLPLDRSCVTAQCSLMLRSPRLWGDPPRGKRSRRHLRVTRFAAPAAYLDEHGTSRPGRRFEPAIGFSAGARSVCSRTAGDLCLGIPWWPRRVGILMARSRPNQRRPRPGTVSSDRAMCRSAAVGQVSGSLTPSHPDRSSNSDR